MRPAHGNSSQARDSDYTAAPGTSVFPDFEKREIQRAEGKPLQSDGIRPTTDRFPRVRGSRPARSCFRCDNLTDSIRRFARNPRKVDT